MNPKSKQPCLWKGSIVDASPWPLTMFVSILTVAFGTALALDARITIVATARRERRKGRCSGAPSGPCIASAGVGVAGLLGAAVTRRYNRRYLMRGRWEVGRSGECAPGCSKRKAGDKVVPFSFFFPLEEIDDGAES